MHILILGLIVLGFAYIVFRQVRKLKREEEELEKIDNFNENNKLLDRAITVVGRRKVLESKIDKIKQENETSDKS